MPRVSIVILNWNTSDDTIECIESIEKTTYRDYEIILVDNGSRRDDLEKLKGFSYRRKRVRLFPLEKNTGFAGGCNFGAQKSYGEYIIFLNNDTIVEPGFVEGMLELFRGEGIGAASSKIFYYDGKRTNIIYNGGNIDIKYYGITREAAMGKADDGSHNKIKEEGIFSGTCFMIPRKLFLKLGGFCDFYFAYYEEGDLSWRLRNAGYKILYAPDSVVYHKCSVSVIKNREQSLQSVLSTRNKYLTFFRNLKIGDFLVLFPLLFSYDVVRVLRYLPSSKGRSLVYFLKGFGKFLISIDKVQRPRNGRLSDLKW